MKNSIIRQSFTSRNDLLNNLGEKIVNILAKAISTQGRAVIAVSGGNTPKKLFTYLSTKKLDWKNVYITLVDERWTDPSSEDSNEYLVRHYLMQNEAKQANFVGLKSDVQTAKEAEETCSNELSNLVKNDFDIVLLGMGEDGHTASFFPNANELNTALTTKQECVALTPPKAPYERMTLSLDRLLKTKHLFLHTEGEKKFSVLNAAVQDGPIEEMPIRAFMDRESKPYLEVYHAQ